MRERASGASRVRVENAALLSRMTPPLLSTAEPRTVEQLDEGWRTSINIGAAREKVRVARALPNLPLLGGALQRGEISYAKVRALTRIAAPETEERLLSIAHHGTASQWSGAQVVPAGVTGRSLRTWDGTPFNVGYAIDVLHPRANPGL
jgi:hypothetical protein